MTDDDYEVAWPKITRRLRRLCDEFGWEMVLSVFSCDMPENRQERARHNCFRSETGVVEAPEE